MFDYSIMSKFRSRKLKGGQPQMNTPPAKPPPQPAPLPATPQKPPPNPVKTPPPGVGAAAKTLEKAEEGISFFEQYGYQLAIGFIVVLIIAIVVYYLFIRDIPGQEGDSASAASGDAASGGAASGGSASGSAASGGAASGGAASGGAASGGAASGGAASGSAASGGAASGGAASGGSTGSTEGFTVDMVNDMTEEDEFEPGRPDHWNNEKQQLLPGMNI